ncbi:symmetrical bis(5'-nucleosyl)-tetraphosphatase [Chitinibacter sp. FCG-7]|uniref:bis(5'-nucleosyl)-tetraphosphatase (symmetrical) n=1 Tax=Chitinibacter mangrovi TaxID=3153927 RepID=A0AAU7FDA4_9NEIS
MAKYVIGDIQGCMDEFMALLGLIQFKVGEDRLILLGDLVNRGPASLAVLRWVYQHRSDVDIVLGNHDLFLLAVWLGFAKAKSGDTAVEILHANDVDVLLEWLIQQPLMRVVDGHSVVHAGIYPGWSQRTAFELANEARVRYAGKERMHWFSVMFGNKPNQWQAELTTEESFRFTVNAFTRMRFCAENKLDFKFKGELDSAPEHLHPWFESGLNCFDAPIIFGHWSALGLKQTPNYTCLDTGCIWGGALTALRLEDRQTFAVEAAHAYQQVGA